MSVFQRGGNFLHRRLTKLYSDTKQSYETATVTSRADSDQDPVLKALHDEFRFQKDRLLAWGLQWSDSNATPSHDVEIDQKLDQAGLGHVVASVMSDIQKLLIESEMIQNLQHSYQDRTSTATLSPTQSDPKSSSGTGHENTDDVDKSKTLLVQLVKCIDTLYTLSESRRVIATDAVSEAPKVFTDASTGDMTGKSLPAIPTVTPRDLPPTPGSGDELIGEAIRRDKLFIPFNSISLASDQETDPRNPPSYEEVMPLDTMRSYGTLDMSKLGDSSTTDSISGKGNCKSVIVEYFLAKPYEVGSDEGQTANYDVYRNALYQARTISERQSSPKISHVGTLPLLGYTIDEVHGRHGFVYEIPRRALPDYTVRCDPIVSNLRDLIPSRRGDTDSPTPNLEDRFRLAFNILLGILQLSVDRQLYRDIKSSNLILILHPSNEPVSAKMSELGSFDVRRPYLLPSPRLARATDSFFSSQSLLWESLYSHARSDDKSEDRERCSASAFDVYSFGLVLLEIGLWTPISRLWKQKYDRSTFASRIKSTYVPKLASRCGTAYMKVVQICVNAPEFAEQTSTGATDMETEQFWIACLIEIGRDLAQCCAIDGEGPPCKPDLEYFDQISRKRTSPGTAGPNRSVVRKLQQAGTRPLTSAAINRAGDSVEPQPRTLRKWNNVDVPQESLDQWNNIIMPKIGKLLQRALGPSRESCSASLMMVGNTPQAARTTICIQCTSVEKVRDFLQRHFKCKRGWGLLVLKGDVRRSGRTRRKKEKNPSGNVSSRHEPSMPEKTAYQQRPRTGASIGAFRDNEHLPPVSYGGAIMVDGKPYGMTVHHMLDAPSDDEDDEASNEDTDSIQRSAARDMDQLLSDMAPFEPGESPLPTCPDILEISDDESDGSTVQPDYLDLDTGQGGFFSSADDWENATPDLEDDAESDWDSDEDAELVDDADEDDHVSVGDIVGVDPADDDEIYVTQPAIDDVEADVFPCLEDRDEEHLASFSLGYVYASSGIRRMVTGNYKHEIDWALIKIHDDRLALPNQISQLPAPAKKARRGKNTMTPSPFTTAPLHSITPAHALPRLHVHCHGRTSGLQTGRISPALSLVRFRGRTSFSSSWTVEGGSIGVPGDSGAWIYDPLAGGLCGHVLAWGQQSQTAYMAPMELLFDDIQRRLGADTIELPRTSHSRHSSLSQPQHQHQQQRQPQLTNSESADTDTTLHDEMSNLHLSISDSTTAAEPGAEGPDRPSPHQHQHQHQPQPHPQSPNPTKSSPYMYPYDLANSITYIHSITTPLPPLSLALAPDPPTATVPSEKSPINQQYLAQYQPQPPPQMPRQQRTEGV